jgi:HrpA-like RNA helicase
MDRSHVNEDTRILYCTTGVLLQKLINTQRMDNYSHIIIDEVHERGIETDLLLLVVKKLMSATATSVKLISMSATFDASKLVEYFSIPIYSLVDEEIISNVVMPSHIAIVERPQQMHIYYLDSIKRDLKMLPIQQNKHNSEPFDRDNPCVTTDAMDTAARILEEGLEKVESEPNINYNFLYFI